MSQLNLTAPHEGIPHAFLQSDCCSQAEPEAIPWEVLTAYQRIAAHEVTLIDTRERSVYQRLHLPEARNIPFRTLATATGKNLLRDLTSNSPLCIYGESAALSEAAANMLVRLGYHTVYYLDHGFLGWQQKGLPCVAEIDGELVQVVTDRVGLPAAVFVFR